MIGSFTEPSAEAVMKGEPERSAHCSARQLSESAPH